MNKSNQIYMVKRENVDESTINEWAKTTCEEKWTITENYVLFRSYSDVTMFKLVFTE